MIESIDTKDEDRKALAAEQRTLVGTARLNAAFKQRKKVACSSSRLVELAASLFHGVRDLSFWFLSGLRLLAPLD
jgi:hypothetical protein